MKFSITDLQEKEGKTGNKYHLATLREESEEGKESSVSSFDLIGHKVGDVVEGDIVQNGQYFNFKIKKEAKAGGFGGGAMVAEKAKAITKAMDRKEDAISKTLDRKEDSFKISATFRDATILTQVWAEKQTAFTTSDEIQNKWLSFRKWLLNNYEVEATDLNQPF